MNKDHRFLILGAGMAGLGAGIALKKAGFEPTILEKESYVGGLFSNQSVDNCDFDFGPKILLLDNSKYRDEILSFLGNNVEQFPVEEKVYLQKYGLLSFPLQRHLIELPKDVRDRVIADLEESLKSPRAIESFKDWLITHYGEYFAEMILIPYEEKKWQLSLDDMDYRWTESRPIKVDTWEVLKGATSHLPANKTYHYPKRGNISVLTESMAREAGTVLTSHTVSSIDLEKKVVIAGGKTFEYDTLISTLPLDTVTGISTPIPNGLARGAKGLKRLSIKVFNLVYEGNHSLEGSAIYFPEKEFVFRRVSVLDNLCPALKRNGATPISVEVSVAEGEKVDDEILYRRIVKELAMIDQFAVLGEPRSWDVMDVDFAYPQQTRGRSYQVADLHRYFAYQDVHHCGRGGTYDYCNGDVAYGQGADLAKDIVRKLELSQELDRTRQTFTVGVSYFGKGDIQQTVDSIRSATYGENAKIIVSTHTRLPKSVVRGLKESGVELIKNVESALLGTHNKFLVDKTTTDLLVLTYAGTVFDTSALKKMLDTFSTNPHLTMAAGLVIPNAPVSPLKRMITIGASVSNRIASEWSGGDNYLSADGRFLMFRTSTISRFLINSEVANCDAYLYFENKRLGGEFVYLREASVSYELPESFHEYAHQSEIFMNSQTELSSMLAMDLHSDYDIPTLLVLKSSVVACARNPVAFFGYLALRVMTGLNRLVTSKKS